MRTSNDVVKWWWAGAGVNTHINMHYAPQNIRKTSAPFVSPVKVMCQALPDHCLDPAKANQIEAHHSPTGVLQV